MTFSKITVAFAAASMLAAAPAFAQSAGTSYQGTSSGVQGTPGQPFPSTTGTPMKGSSTMMKSGTTAKAPVEPVNKPTASGGQPGGNPERR